MLAPGGGLVSALAPESDFAHLCPNCIVDTRYFRAGGTSMASGVVSGAAALRHRGAPGLDARTQVKGALLATLDDVPGAGGVIDVYAALDAGVVLVDEPRSEHPDRPGDRADRLGAGELPARELPRCERLEPQRASGAGRASAATAGSRAAARSIPTRVSFRRVSFRKTTDFDG